MVTKIYRSDRMKIGNQPNNLTNMLDFLFGKSTQQYIIINIKLNYKVSHNLNDFV